VRLFSVLFLFKAAVPTFSTTAGLSYITCSYHFYRRLFFFFWHYFPQGHSARAFFSFFPFPLLPLSQGAGWSMPEIPGWTAKNVWGFMGGILRGRILRQSKADRNTFRWRARASFFFSFLFFSGFPRGRHFRFSRTVLF